MASKKTTSQSKPRVSELLDDLASFLYDAYQHTKEKDGDKIKLGKGQNAENKENIK